MCNSPFIRTESRIKTIIFTCLSLFFCFSTQVFAEPEIDDFYLVDVDTGQWIREVSDGDDIILPLVPQKLSIRAYANFETESVKMYIGQHLTSTENNEPYALRGDSLANGYHPVPELRTKGTIRISADPFSKKNASGEGGARKTITLRIIQPDFIVNDERDISDSHMGDGKCDTSIVLKQQADPSVSTAITKAELLSATSPVIEDNQIYAELVPATTATGINISDFDWTYFTNSTCTLRAAVEEANAMPGLQTILLPRPKYDYADPDFIEDHVYKLTQNKGLQITDSLQIMGDGRPTIDANNESRIFEIVPKLSTNNKMKVELDSLDLMQGRGRSGSSLINPDALSSLHGGAIYMDGNVHTYINDSVVRDSYASNGGGMSVTGGASLALVDSEVHSNVGGANARSGRGIIGGINQRGGGIFVYGKGSKAAISRSMIYDNRSARGGGIDVSYGGSVDLVNSLVVKNEAFTSGGGIRSTEGDLRITFSTIASNAVNTLRQGPRLWSHGGGGLYIYNGKDGKVSIGSSVVAENLDYYGSPDCATYQNSVITGYRNVVMGVINSECIFEDHVYKNHDGLDAGNSRKPLDPGFLDSRFSNSPYSLVERYIPRDLNSILVDTGARNFTIGYTFFSCAWDFFDVRHLKRPQGFACDIGALEMKQ